MTCSSLDDIFTNIKTLTNKHFYGKIILIFESGNLVHSEITQKLKPNSFVIERISITGEST